MNTLFINSDFSWVITFLASFLIWLMYAGFFAFWLIGKKVTKKQVAQVIIASFVAWSLSEIIKYIFPTLRPFQTDGSPPMTITIPSDSAFPSTHSAVAFGMATSVYFHHKKMGIVLLAGALVVGVARVLANVHYPGDILGGALIGSLDAFVLRALMLV
jgi:undecaprenyl-diphosphatase